MTDRDTVRQYERERKAAWRSSKDAPTQNLPVGIVQPLGIAKSTTELVSSGFDVVVTRAT